MKNRIGRVVLGILALLILGVYSYIHFAAAPFTDDMEEISEKAYQGFYGTNKDGSPIETPDEEVAEEAPAEEVGSLEASPETAPAEEPTVDPNSPEGKAAALGLPKPPDIDITSWEYLMANPDHSIQEYEPPLADYSTASLPANIRSNQGMKFDERIVEPMTNFIVAAGEQGLDVFLSSGYRSFDEQTYLFNRKLGQGYTEEQAKAIVAVPGTSEHQTGLVCDITDRYYEFKDSSLENTELYKWMSAHCHEYGFIVRFPKDKEDITQIIYEPWHFRYVGVEAATYMVENGLCYEEFYALYVNE